MPVNCVLEPAGEGSGIGAGYGARRIDLEAYKRANEYFSYELK